MTRTTRLAGLRARGRTATTAERDALALAEKYHADMLRSNLELLGSQDEVRTLRGEVLRQTSAVATLTSENQRLQRELREAHEAVVKIVRRLPQVS